VAGTCEGSVWGVGKGTPLKGRCGGSSAEGMSTVTHGQGGERQLDRYRSTSNSNDIAWPVLVPKKFRRLQAPSAEGWFSSARSAPTRLKFQRNSAPLFLGFRDQP